MCCHSYSKPNKPKVNQSKQTGYTNQAMSMAYWNIHGIGQKLNNDNSLSNIINKYDICMLAETWLSTTAELNIDGYHSFVKSRPKHIRAKRHSGGIALLVRQEYRKGVKLVETSNENVIWVKLDKQFFNVESHLYLGAIYIPPKGSTYVKDKQISPFSKLLEEIHQFTAQGNVLIMGDMNARTGILPDFINENGNNHLDLPVNYQTDGVNKIRQSCDDKINEYGKQLIDICKDSQLRIVNGRAPVDMYGQYTSFNKNGCSVVDYSLSDEYMLSNILYFYIHPPNHLSDHSMLSMRIKLLKPKCEETCNTSQVPPKFIWSNKSKEVFQQWLCSSETTSSLDQFMSKTFNQNVDDVNECNNLLTDIIINVGEKSLKVSKSGQKKKRKQKWYDPNVEQLKKDIISLGKLIKKYPQESHLRGSYVHKKKQYHRLVKNLNKEYKQNILNKISCLEQKDPKEFWRLVNYLRSNVKEGNDLNVNILYEHFKALNNKDDLYKLGKFDDRFEHKIKEQLKDLQDNNIPVPQLDNPVTKAELDKTVKSLSVNKAVAQDRISN